MRCWDVLFPVVAFAVWCLNLFGFVFLTFSGDGNVYDEMSALGPVFYVGAQI